MTEPAKWLIGEYARSLDDRYRLSIPSELWEAWWQGDQQAVLVKERRGCLSLWSTGAWREKLEPGVRVVEAKLQAGRLADRLAQVQAFGRLLSTRHRTVPLAGRGRLVIPEGFREFLQVEPGQEVIVVGAAVCLEIWETAAWRESLHQEIERFGTLLDDLSR